MYIDASAITASSDGRFTGSGAAGAEIEPIVVSNAYSCMGDIHDNGSGFHENGSEFSITGTWISLSAGGCKTPVGEAAPVAADKYGVKP